MSQSEKGIYDVAVIGLGPAGATLARLLDSSLSVVAIDRKSAEQDDGFRKPCGGLLAPDAQKAVSRFGLVFPKELMVNPQIFTVKTIDLKQKLLRHYQRFYINFDRHKFDLWLMSLIPSHVKCVTNAVCVSIKKDGGAYIINYKKDGRLLSVKAKQVVGADGANSKVRRLFFPRLKIKRYAAIQQWFKDINSKPFYSSIFDSDLTDCYGWTISKDGYFIIGGAFPVKNAREKFEKLKKKTMEWGFVYGEPVKTEACVVLRPKGLLDICTGKDGVFLTGEAAGFISPSSLEGISYAFDSAFELAMILNEKPKNEKPKNANKAYFYKTLKLRFKILLKNIKSIVIYTPFIRKLIMKSGIQKVNLYNAGRR